MAEQTEATTHALIIKRMKRQTADKSWGSRHVLAWQKGGPLVAMIVAAAEYADAHRKRYDSPLGNDYFLGAQWRNIIAAIRELLNGELGGLDGGTLDGLLVDMLRLEGFDPDTLEKARD